MFYSDRSNLEEVLQSASAYSAEPIQGKVIAFNIFSVFKLCQSRMLDLLDSVRGSYPAPPWQSPLAWSSGVARPGVAARRPARAGGSDVTALNPNPREGACITPDDDRASIRGSISFRLIEIHGVGPPLPSRLRLWRFQFPSLVLWEGLVLWGAGPISKAAAFPRAALQALTVQVVRRTVRRPAPPYLGARCEVMRPGEARPGSQTIIDGHEQESYILREET